MHGDLRWENVLVAAEGKPRVWLVDWEMGGAGERAWDAGCFAAACISAWLCSIPSVPDVPPADLADEAEIHIDALAPASDAFWTAYREAAPAVDDDDAWAERCAQLAAVRLVHTASSARSSTPACPRRPVAHLQVAAHVLEDPVHAAHELLRMP